MNDALPLVSVIIPMRNEAGYIERCLASILAQDYPADRREIIVVDGGSGDETVAEATKAGAKVILSPRRGRAAQMNTGAREARGNVLYFLHADSYPPEGFAAQILRHIGEGYTSGCYRLQFDHPHWFLRANSWFTRFDVDAVRFGDQSLFVTRDVFDKAGGFPHNKRPVYDEKRPGFVWAFMVRVPSGK